MQTTNYDDWKLFTKTILMMSSVAIITRDEIDNLITTRTYQDHEIDRLRRARSSVASLAAIADHYEGER